MSHNLLTFNVNACTNYTLHILFPSRNNSEMFTTNAYLFPLMPSIHLSFHPSMEFPNLKKLSNENQLYFSFLFLSMCVFHFQLHSDCIQIVFGENDDLKINESYTKNKYRLMLNQFCILQCRWSNWLMVSCLKRLFTYTADGIPLDGFKSFHPTRSSWNKLLLCCLWCLWCLWCVYLLIVESTSKFSSLIILQSIKVNVVTGFDSFSNQSLCVRRVKKSVYVWPWPRFVMLLDVDWSLSIVSIGADGQSQGADGHNHLLLLSQLLLLHDVTFPTLFSIPLRWSQCFTILLTIHVRRWMLCKVSVRCVNFNITTNRVDLQFGLFKSLGDYEISNQSANQSIDCNWPSIAHHHHHHLDRSINWIGQWRIVIGTHLCRDNTLHNYGKKNPSLFLHSNLVKCVAREIPLIHGNYLEPSLNVIMTCNHCFGQQIKGNWCWGVMV